MTEVDPTLSDLARWVSTWEWPVGRQEMLDLAEERGWSLVLDQAKSLEWHTDLPPGVSAVVLDDEVADVTITTSPDLGDDGGSRALADLFAGQVDAVSDVLGPPDRRVPGRNPSASWRLAGGAGLKVAAASGGCFWVVTSPRFVDIQSDLAERS